jgi:prepilin signal peptidase PulO-like enzyme (type II secretory pathway)
MKSQVPFAPFLAVGVFLAIFLPLIFPDITRWLWF